MDYFLYRDGVLHAEDIPVTEITANIGTPVYIYSAKTIRRHIDVFDKALSTFDHHIFYSVKANSNQAILTLLGQLGVGMDVVSIGEYKRARAAGIPGERIVFSGVGKTRAELEYTLLHGIYQYNVESENELELLNQIAIAHGKKAPVAFRVNPDVDAKTHAKISTGKSENKFGIPFARAPEIYANAAMLEGIELVGIDTHIGSQLTDLAPFDQAFAKIRDLLDRLRAQGIALRRVDLGGGLGIPYERSNELPPLPMDYGKVVEKHFHDADVEIGIEPGRMVMGNSGILVSEVIFNKRGADRDFMIIDAAMNDLLRPAMYDAFHDIIPVYEADNDIRTMDIVGQVCETGDTFARARDVAYVSEGGLVALRTAGAYGAVMASEYNTRPLVPEVLVDGNQYAVIRKRPTIEEMIERDIIPNWLTEKVQP